MALFAGRRGSRWCLPVVLVVLALLVTACGGKQTAAPKQAEGSKKGAPATAEKSEAKGKQAEADFNFASGKTLTIIVATKAGGGYDTYGRMVAPFIEKYLPGSTVIVKNVSGGGHIIGTNEINNARPDGLTFGIFNQGLITSQLVGMEGIRFDLRKMSWLGNATDAPRVLIMGKNTPYKTLEDIKASKKQVILGTGGVGSSNYVDSLMLSNALGYNFKVVPGYEGQETELAMMRGEIHGQIGSLDSLSPMLESGEAIPVLFVARKRPAEFPNVPLLQEVAVPEAKEIVSLMNSQAVLSRVFAGPPQMPEPLLSVLRQVFDKSFADPDLLARAKQAKQSINYMNGKETEKAVLEALGQPPEVIKLLKQVVSQ